MDNHPKSQGNYKIATRYNDLIFTSGITPRVNGELVYEGKIDSIKDTPVLKDIVKLAAKNTVSAINSVLKNNEKVECVVSFNCFINVKQNFSDHTKVADYASEYLIDQFGIDNIGSRMVIGANSLPSSAPIEVQLIVSVL